MCTWLNDITLEDDEALKHHKKALVGCLFSSRDDQCKRVPAFGTKTISELSAGSGTGTAFGRCETVTALAGSGS